MLRKILEFSRGTSGNIAIMFTLVLVPMLIGGGIGLDMMRIGATRGELTEASDAGLLAAARSMIIDDNVTPNQATAMARRYFDANGGLNDNIIIEKFQFKHNPATETFTLLVKGKMRTTLLGVMGQEWMPVNINSEAKIGPPRILEVALVLDNTRSMDGAKMTSLKSAANLLVDKLMDDTGNEVLVGLVPFSNYVNVGLSRRSVSWISVPDDYSTTEYKCWNTYPDATKSNCRTVTNGCSSDGVPYDCQTCDWDYGDPVEECGDVTSNYEWRGCVGSRADPFDVEDKAFGGNKVPGILNAWCPKEISTMSLVKADVKAAIDGMWVQGDTYIATGLSWGLRMLSNPEPFTQGRTYKQIADKKGMKAMVLMTDGANTRSPRWPDGDHWGWDQTIANDRTAAACAVAQKANIEVFTVAFEVSDTTIKTLLEDCASSRGNYFDASDPAALERAFENIAKRLQDLALTK